MKRIIFTIALFIAANSFCQGTVVAKRFEDCPEDQWFVFPGKKTLGMSVYISNPEYVKNEVLRIIDYYKASRDIFVETYDETIINIDLENGYKVFIIMSEVDYDNWKRTIYLIVK